MPLLLVDMPSICSSRFLSVNSRALLSIFKTNFISKANNSVVAMLYLTDRFRVAVRLFSNRSQMTSKCGKNKKVAHEAQLMMMFSPHFDVLCDLLLNRRTATWNLFVLYNKELKCTKKKF